MAINLFFLHGVFSKHRDHSSIRQRVSLWLLMFVAGMASAQPIAYQVSGQFSYTVPNESGYDFIASRNYGLSFDMAWNFWGDAFWQQQRQGAQFGLKGSFFYCDNPIAGHRFALVATMDNPLYSWNGGNDELSWLLDAGLSLMTNPYKRSHEERNDFIGSYLNCAIDVGLTFRHGLSNGDALALSLMLAHSSNGYLKKPNMGLNFLLAEFGYRWRRTRFDSQSTVHSSQFSVHDSQDKVHQSHFFLSYSPSIVKARYPYDADPYYYAYTAQFGYLYALSPMRMVGASVDLMYNFSHTDLAVSYGVEQPFPMYVGLCADYETYWDRLSVRVGMAAYLLRSDVEGYPIYERVGLYYHFGGKLRQFAGVSMKAHYAHVDYIEWTYGIEL